jgi:hypothetical protein
MMRIHWHLGSCQHILIDNSVSIAKRPYFTVAHPSCNYGNRINLIFSFIVCIVRRLVRVYSEYDSCIHQYINHQLDRYAHNRSFADFVRNLEWTFFKVKRHHSSL